MDTKFKNELLASAFVQFAENQKSKEQSFLKILGFLGTVVFGFALSYHLYNIQNISFKAYTMIYISAVLLLFGGAWVVVIIEYSYRRDQYIQDRIRKYAGIDEKIYPESYDPFNIYLLKRSKNMFNIFMNANIRKYFRDIGLFKNKNLKYNHVNFIYLRWLPDLFIPYFCVFPVFLFLMTFWYSSNLHFTINLSNVDYFSTIILYCSYGLLGIVLYLPIHYSNKLLRRLAVWCNYIPFGLLTGKKQKHAFNVLAELKIIVENKCDSTSREDFIKEVNSKIRDKINQS